MFGDHFEAMGEVRHALDHFEIVLPQRGIDTK